MELEEENDCDKNHNIQNYCRYDDQKSDNDTKITASELIDHDSNGKEKGQDCDKRH